jgi:hypothetical protein
MKKWVKQEVNFLDIRAIYTDITTDQKIQETRLGQCFIANTNKLCDKPTEFFIPKEFDGWDFWVGGYALDDGQTVYEIGTYCCDGDGIITVVLLTDGTIQLFDQGQPEMILSSNLEEAMEKATDYIKVCYPEIYEINLAPIKS